jgi:hypothetical protein
VISVGEEHMRCEYQRITSRQRHTHIFGTNRIYFFYVHKTNMSGSSNNKLYYKDIFTFDPPITISQTYTATEDATEHTMWNDGRHHNFCTFIAQCTTEETKTAKVTSFTGSTSFTKDPTDPKNGEKMTFWLQNQGKLAFQNAFQQASESAQKQALGNAQYMAITRAQGKAGNFAQLLMTKFKDSNNDIKNQQTYETTTTIGTDKVIAHYFRVQGPAAN